ncbi:MAG: hypothetical protein IJA86_07475 [Clostridia bacterium]|nr:hypothetical protein [Clostridia bacterium]
MAQLMIVFVAVDMEGFRAIFMREPQFLEGIIGTVLVPLLMDFEAQVLLSAGNGCRMMSESEVFWVSLLN